MNLKLEHKYKNVQFHFELLKPFLTRLEVEYPFGQ